MNSGGCLATREGKLHCQRSLSLTGNLLKARRDCLAAYVEICNRGTYPPACMRKVVAEFIGTFALVFAGTGAGGISSFEKQALKAVLSLPVASRPVLVRPSRTGNGRVVAREEYDRMGMIPVDTLNPQKARILLMLTLTKTNSLEEIRRMFTKY